MAKSRSCNLVNGSLFLLFTTFAGLVWAQNTYMQTDTTTVETPDQATQSYESYFYTTDLFGTEVTQPVLDTVIEITTLYPLLKIKDFAFATKLRNPCEFANTSVFESETLFGTNEKERHEAQQGVISDFVSKTDDLLERLQTAMKTVVMCDCETLELPPLDEELSIDELLENNVTDVSRHFFPALLNHTAYVYFMGEQIKKYPDGLECDSDDLLQNVLSMAARLRELTCYLRLATVVFENKFNPTSVRDGIYFEAVTAQIMNMKVDDLYMRSRRAIRDCQIVSSTLSFITKMSNYFHAYEARQHPNVRLYSSMEL